MSDNDLIKRGDVRNEINRLTFNPLVNELLYRILDAIPAVPQEMTAREFLRTLQRKADAENLITVMKFVGNDWSTPPAFGKWVEDTEKWAREHTEERSEE